MLSVKNRLLLVLYFKNYLISKKNPFNKDYLFTGEILEFVSPSFGTHSFYSALNCALIEKEVKKSKYNAKTILKLTDLGEKKVKENYPVTTKEERIWDGKWRVLIYDIPEKQKVKREMLRRTIAKFGFGRLQNSVYITSFPLEKEILNYLEKHNLSDRVIFFTTETIFTGSDRQLAAKTWDIEKVNNNYKRLLLEIRDLKSPSIRVVRKIKAEFLELLTFDPFLPTELLPNDWYREKLAEEIRDLNLSQ